MLLVNKKILSKPLKAWHSEKYADRKQAAVFVETERSILFSVFAGEINLQPPQIALILWRA